MASRSGRFGSPRLSHSLLVRGAWSNYGARVARDAWLLRLQGARVRLAQLLRRWSWGFMVLLLVAAPARAQYEAHRFAGALLGFGVEHQDGASGGRSLKATLGFLEAGASKTVGYDRNDVTLRARLGRGGGQTEVAVLGGYRAYFGDEAFKTYVDLDVALHLAPHLVLGPYVAFGVRYDVRPWLSLLAGAGIQIGYGQAFRFSVEGTVGVSFRFDITETR